MGFVKIQLQQPHLAVGLELTDVTLRL